MPCPGCWFRVVQEMYDGAVVVRVVVPPGLDEEVVVRVVVPPGLDEEVVVRVAVPPGLGRVPGRTTEPAYPPSPSIGNWPGAKVASYGATIGHASIVSDVVVDGSMLHPTLSEHVVL